MKLTHNITKGFTYALLRKISQNSSNTSSVPLFLLAAVSRLSLLTAKLRAILQTKLTRVSDLRGGIMFQRPDKYHLYTLPLRVLPVVQDIFRCFSHGQAVFLSSSYMACSERSKNKSMILLSYKCVTSFPPHLISRKRRANIIFYYKCFYFR